MAARRRSELRAGLACLASWPCLVLWDGAAEGGGACGGVCAVPGACAGGLGAWGCRAPGRTMSSNPAVPSRVHCLNVEHLRRPACDERVFTALPESAPAGQPATKRKLPAGAPAMHRSCNLPVATAMTGRELARAASMSRGVSPTTQTRAPLPAISLALRAACQSVRREWEMVAESAEAEPLAQPRLFDLDPADRFQVAGGHAQQGAPSVPGGPASASTPGMSTRSSSCRRSATVCRMASRMASMCGSRTSAECPPDCRPRAGSPCRCCRG